MKLQNVALCAVLAGALFILPSCAEIQCGGSKANFQNQYENLLEKIEDLNYDLDDKRWKPFDERFRTLVEECYPMYEDEMSEREKSEFWLSTLEFYSGRYGDGLAEVFRNQGEYISEEVVENLEEVLEHTGRKLEDFMDENGQELEKLFEEVGKDIEDWAERLKEILEQ